MVAIVSLFSGCGGFDLGAIRAGHQIVSAYELDSSFCSDYKHVTSHDPIQSDLTRIDPLTIPDSEGIVGGPPCQEFSSARHWDKQGAGGMLDLWPVTLAIVNAKRPLWFLFENVAGMIQSKKHQPYTLSIINQLKDIGYVVDYRVIDAADYGVPQNRLRLFIAGRRDGKRWAWAEPTHNKEKTLFSQKHISWRQALDEWITSTTERSHLPQWVIESYPSIPANAYFDCQNANHAKKHREDDKPAYTVTKSNGGRARITVRGDIYRLDNDARAILQTLPKGIKSYEAVGNAVPSLLSESLFRAANL